MEDDELLTPLPELDGDDDEPPEPADLGFGDGLAEELLGSGEDVGLDASAAEAVDEASAWLELPSDDEGGVLGADEAGPESGLGDLLDDGDAAPPPLSAGEAEDGAWEDHHDLDQAPPLGADDGGEVGLEEPHLDGELGEDDAVDLPGLDQEESAGGPAAGHL